MERTTGIVLRKRRLTESSLIISWLTERHGRVDTAARGACKPGSKFAGILDLFFECEIDVVESRRSDLHTLTEASLLNARPELRRSMEVTRVCSYFTALTTLATETCQPVPEVYDLLSKALGYMESAEPSRNVILRFEKRLCLILGIAAERGVALQAHQVLGRHLGWLPPDRQALLDSLRDV